LVRGDTNQGGGNFYEMRSPELQTQESFCRFIKQLNIQDSGGTVLEGSFGNEKNHYLLNKIKARTQPTEVAWIFFGMLAANASIISNRIADTQKRKRA